MLALELQKVLFCEEIYIIYVDFSRYSSVIQMLMLPCILVLPILMPLRSRGPQIVGLADHMTVFNGYSYSFAVSRSIGDPLCTDMG